MFDCQRHTYDLTQRAVDDVQRGILSQPCLKPSQNHKKVVHTGEFKWDTQWHLALAKYF